MYIKVGKAYHYHLMYGRVSSIDGDIVYFVTPYGSLFNPTKHVFDHMAYDIEEDHKRLKEFEQQAIDAGVELYRGLIPEFTNAARASRYGYIYGDSLFDRETQKPVWGTTEILKIIRDLESKNRATEEALEHVMTAVKNVAFSGDFAIGDDAISTLSSAYEDVTEGNVGRRPV